MNPHERPDEGRIDADDELLQLDEPEQNRDEDEEDTPCLIDSVYHSIPGRQVEVGYDRTLDTEGVGAWQDRVLAIGRERNRPPTLFSRNYSELVRVQRTRDGASIAVVTVNALQHQIAKWSNWGEVFTRKGGRKVRITADHRFYRDLAAHALAAPEFDPEIFPALDSVTQVPTFTATGRLVVEPGYDAEARLWFAPPPDFRLDPVPEIPSPEDVERARSFILDEMLGEFPFEGPGDRANAVALILQPLARRMIPSLTPLYFLAAPTAGTGKSTLAKIVGLPATGQLTFIKSDPGTDDQLRKLITAALAQGKPLMLIDNVSREIGGGSFAAILTSEIWEDRPPHSQKLVTFENTVTWVATANSPTFSRELALRTVFINIDSGLKDPSTRRFARPMPQHAQVHRFEFTHACLVLISHWVAQGRPRGTAFFGRYPEWAATMSGLLESVGIQGFLTNATAAESLDADGQRWRALVRIWLTRWGTRTVMLCDLYDLIDNDDNLGVLFAPTMGGSLVSRVRQEKLRLAMKDQGRRPYLGHYIEVGPHNDTDFLLVPIPPTPTPTPTPTPEPEPTAPESPTRPTPAPNTIYRKGPAGIVACTEGAKADAEENYPRLLAELGSAREVARLGDRLQSDMRRSAPDGPGEALAERLRPALLKRGEKRFGAAQAGDYVLWYGINVGGIAEAEPTADA